MSGRNLEVLLAFIFGVAFLTALLILVVLIPSPTQQQFEVVRIVLALAAGGVAAMIPGFLNIDLRSGAAISLRAGGALAVFAVVYFCSPAHWAASVTQTLSVNTRGPNSPAIIGNGNTVTTSGKPSGKPR